MDLDLEVKYFTESQSFSLEVQSQEPSLCPTRIWKILPKEFEDFPEELEDFNGIA